MADAILAYAPDVVGLNEMRGDGTDAEYTAQTEELSRLTGMKYYYFAKAIDVPGKGPYGNGILSKIPIESVSVIAIPTPKEKKYNGYYEARCILKAELQGGVCVLVTHMGLNPDEQEDAVSKVIENVNGGKCILMGDFNMKPTDPILAPIFEKMSDTAELFDGEKLSYPSDAPTIKIDYVFTSRDARVLSADIPVIVASDHRPHVAEVEFL